MPVSILCRLFDKDCGILKIVTVNFEELEGLGSNEFYRCVLTQCILYESAQLVFFNHGVQIKFPLVPSHTAAIRLSPHIGNTVNIHPQLSFLCTRSYTYGTLIADTNDYISHINHHWSISLVSIV